MAKTRLQRSGETRSRHDSKARTQPTDPTGPEPAAHAQGFSQRQRPGVGSEGDRRPAYQAVAPETEAGLYLVPKVIE